MKKIAILGLVTLLCSGAMAQTEDYKYLVAHSSTGNQSVELSTVQKISFSDDYAIINVVSGTNISLPLAELQKITFSTTPTAIAALPGETEGLKVDNGTITASGTGLLCVYSMKGQLISIAKVQTGQTVSLSTLPQGVYIIRLGDKAIKVTK